MPIVSMATDVCTADQNQDQMKYCCQLWIAHLRRTSGAEALLGASIDWRRHGVHAARLPLRERAHTTVAVDALALLARCDQAHRDGLLCSARTSKFVHTICSLTRVCM